MTDLQKELFKLKDEKYKEFHSKLIPNIDSGKIIGLTLGGEEHFDANTNQHYHFKCTLCGRYFDLLTESLDPSIMNMCLQNFDGEADGYSLIFYGKCGECKKH